MNQINILLVEDNEDDVFIIKRVFKKLKVTNRLNVVSDGQEALDYIFGEGEYADADNPTPGLILMDINMPRLNGFQAMEKLKAHPIYKVIPVIMLTVSDRDEDIVRSYQGGAVSYISKPMKFENFVKVIEQFDIYWSLVSKIPEVKQEAGKR